MLATALAGRPLAVRAVPRIGRAWDGSAQPEVVDLPLGGNDDTWRLAVLRHAMDLLDDGRFAFKLERAAASGLTGESGGTLPTSASDVDRCLASWPRPVLLRRLWWRLDRQRVDARIREGFPGARGRLGRPHVHRTVAVHDQAHRPLILERAGQRTELGFGHGSLVRISKALVKDRPGSLVTSRRSLMLPWRRVKNSLKGTPL